LTLYFSTTAQICVDARAGLYFSISRGSDTPSQKATHKEGCSRFLQQQFQKILPRQKRGRKTMRPWAPDDTTWLINHWRTEPASRIGRDLHRTRSAVCGKVNRLRRDGAELPKIVFKPAPKPPKKRKKRIRNKRLAVAPPPLEFIPPPPPSLTPGEPCTIYDLNNFRCHWPLGAIDEPATEYCGALVTDGRVYCPHHHRIAHSQWQRGAAW
jgi:GcrA cell cycle regulator